MSHACTVSTSREKASAHYLQRGKAYSASLLDKRRDLPSLPPEPGSYLFLISLDYKRADSVNELVTETETSLLL